MGQSSELENKVKVFQNFKKVINVRLNESMQKINVIEKKISFISKMSKNMNIFFNILNGKSDFFDSYIENNTINTHALIIFQTDDDSEFGEYSNKKILQFIEQKRKETDKYNFYIIGSELYEHIMHNSTDEEMVDVIAFADYDKKTDDKVKNDVSINAYTDIFEKISFYSINLYEDMLVKKISVCYDDIRLQKELVQIDILPFGKDKFKDSNVEDNEEEIDFESFSKTDKNIYNIFLSLKDEKKIKFDSEIIDVNKLFLKFLLSSSIKFTILEHLLNTEIRKLNSLQESNKNIDTNVALIHGKMMSIRKEGITNEMLSLATNLLRKKSKKTSEFLRKKKEEEDAIKKLKAKAVK